MYHNSRIMGGKPPKPPGKIGRGHDSLVQECFWGVDTRWGVVLCVEKKNRFMALRMVTRKNGFGTMTCPSFPPTGELIKPSDRRSLGLATGGIHYRLRYSKCFETRVTVSRWSNCWW